MDAKKELLKNVSALFKKHKPGAAKPSPMKGKKSGTEKC